MIQFLIIEYIFSGLLIEGTHEKTLAEIRKAIEHGVTDGCPPEYTCKKENIKNFLKENRKWKYRDINNF